MNADQLRDLTRRVLMDIGLHSPAAENLLMGTFAQESHLGEYIRQINGPALGIGQMEPATHDDIWRNYIAYKTDRPWFSAIWTFVPGRPAFTVLQDGSVEVREFPPAAHLEWNLAYAIAMTRIHYLRVPERLPDADDVWGLARYFKQFYNTHLGRATEAQFVANAQRLLGVIV